MQESLASLEPVRLLEPGELSVVAVAGMQMPCSQ